MTGICHHAQDCIRYQTQCHDCHLLYRGHKHDLSYKTFVKKQRLYKNAPITFVACSRWLEGLAQKSILTHGHTVTNIPNPINTNLFHPTDKLAARRKLNLPEDKRLLLFSSMKITDKKKGIDYLVEACRLLNEMQPDFCRELAVVVVGKESQQYADLFPFPVYCLNYVGKEKEMPTIYNAVDLFVTPLASGKPAQHHYGSHVVRRALRRILHRGHPRNDRPPAQRLRGTLPFCRRPGERHLLVAHRRRLPKPQYRSPPQSAQHLYRTRGGNEIHRNL